MMDFTVSCLRCLPSLWRQLRPWMPWPFTSTPQWWQQVAVPSHSPTAILRETSSNIRPKEEIGRTWNQAPDSLAIQLYSLAWSPLCWVDSNKEDAEAAVDKSSRSFCFPKVVPCDESSVWFSDHRVKATSTEGAGKSDNTQERWHTPVLARRQLRPNWLTGQPEKHYVHICPSFTDNLACS